MWGCGDALHMLNMLKHIYVKKLQMASAMEHSFAISMFNVCVYMCMCAYIHTCMCACVDL